MRRGLRKPLADKLLQFRPHIRRLNLRLQSLPEATTEVIINLDAVKELPSPFLDPCRRESTEVHSGGGSAMVGVGTGDSAGARPEHPVDTKPTAIRKMLMRIVNSDRTTDGTAPLILPAKRWIRHRPNFAPMDPTHPDWHWEAGQIRPEE